MSGIPRTGLFSRNHVASLSQRNRALQQQQQQQQKEQVNENSNAMERINSEEALNEKQRGTLNDTINSPASSSYTSLPRDPEGFDDLDAYFNRASTPQKTPKSAKKSLGNSLTASKTGTPLSSRKAAAGASVLVAKPLKMISSKIAEHYKKEPRVAVSMSEVLEKMSQEQSESLADEIDHNEQEQEPEEEYSDRIQRAKRELEEMSIAQDDSMNMNIEEVPTSAEYSNNHTEVHLASFIKSTVISEASATTALTDSVPIIESHDYNHDDDTLMDRLVEEMLVNDEEAEAPSHVNNTMSNASVAATAAKATKAKTKRSQGGGLARRPMTYLPGTEINEAGMRRSCRLKMEPLRYWANEKVCYGRAEDPSITLPVIVNVIKKPELDDPTFAMGLTRKRRRPVDGNASKLKAQAFGPDCDVEAEINCYERPGEEDVRLVALSHHHVQGDPVKDCSFKIHTIFTEGTYMSSGQLIFPWGSQKPTKNSARHALVFYVISGSFRVEINRDSFVIGPGGQFHVPRANHYTITHISEDRNIGGRLFFCHCKDNAEM